MTIQFTTDEKIKQNYEAIQLIKAKLRREVKPNVWSKVPPALPTW